MQDREGTYRNYIPISFEKIHGNSPIIQKTNLWGVMIAYVLQAVSYF